MTLTKTGTKKCLGLQVTLKGFRALEQVQKRCAERLSERVLLKKMSKPHQIRPEAADR